MKEIKERNIAFRLAYLGTAYHGWQYQNNAITVQQVLQQAIGKATGCQVSLSGVGRTDAGVHARIYVANARMATSIPLDKLPLAISAYLPPDISVSRAVEVPWDFDARFQCQKKEYTYLIHNSRVRDPFITTGPISVPLVWIMTPWRKRRPILRENRILPPCAARAPRCAAPCGPCTIAARKKRGI